MHIIKGSTWGILVEGTDAELHVSQIARYDSIQNNNRLYLPYSQFTASFYTPFEILTSVNPVGSDGPLSQDSYLAKIGAQSLKYAFEERVALEIYQHTGQ